MPPTPRPAGAELPVTPVHRRSPRGRQELGWWWLFIAGVAVGLLWLCLGWLHAGGIVMALAFGLAAAIRLARPDGGGGLVIRSRPVDVVFYLSAALNSLGAVLLVERLVPLRLVGGADLALLVVLAVVWWRGERDLRRARA